MLNNRQLFEFCCNHISTLNEVTYHGTIASLSGQVAGAALGKEGIQQNLLAKIKRLDDYIGVESVINQ